jgi:glycosyltransferase involved in cell wall biosynthesis
VAATVEDDVRLLAAFASYLRRQLDDDGPAVLEVPLGSSLRRARADATVAVVAGRRSPLAERVFALRSGMRPQWRGRAHLEPGSPGIDFAVWDRWRLEETGEPPPGFDVLAVVTTYNESDVVEQLLERLLAGGMRVHVIDNWSTDGTEALVGQYLAPGRVTMERFPPDGPSRYFELRALLERLGEVAHGSGADWVVHHDADEVHESPWPGVGKRRALWAVERWGFNCVDHTAVEFRPVDERFQPGDDLVGSFELFEFGKAPAHFTLLKAWKPQQSPVVNADSGGHDLAFAGRRVFPYKFPIRHYPLRSSAHARRKLFAERRARWSPEERARGWHTHYDHFHEGSSFLWDGSTLHRWATVDDELLLQRLSGVGLENNPRPEEAARPPAS